MTTQKWAEPVPPLPSRTFLHGLDDTSNEALNALLCWVVRMVRGRLGRLWSLPSSAAPFPAPWAALQRLSSSSLLPEKGERGLLRSHCLGQRDSLRGARPRLRGLHGSSAGAAQAGLRGALSEVVLPSVSSPDLPGWGVA